MFQKIINFALAALCCLSVTASAQQVMQKEDAFLSQAVTELEKLFSRDFQMRFTSDELAKFISDNIQEVSKQLGMPLNIDIRDFLVKFDQETGTFRNQLRLKNADDFLGKAMQRQVNTMLQSNNGRIGRRISDLSLGPLQKFIDFMEQNKDAFKYTGEVDNLSRFSFQPEKLVLYGIPVKNLEVLVDRKNKTIPRMNAVFNENSRAALNLTYVPQNLKGRQIMVPDKIRLEHNLPEVRGIALPPAMSMDFGKIR